MNKIKVDLDCWLRRDRQTRNCHTKIARKIHQRDQSKYKNNWREAPAPGAPKTERGGNTRTIRFSTPHGKTGTIPSPPPFFHPPTKNIKRNSSLSYSLEFPGPQPRLTHDVNKYARLDADSPRSQKYPKQPFETTLQLVEPNRGTLLNMVWQEWRQIVTS